VSKRPKGKTFADVVRAVEQQPVVPESDYSGVVDPSGKRWHRDEAEVSPARALELAGDGASVAWDNCGCGGYCGFDWYTPEDVARMVAAGTPEVSRHTKRRRGGSLSVWTSGDRDVLVVAENAVRWGDVISG
jgi:hypothetical protein